MYFTPFGSSDFHLFRGGKVEEPEKSLARTTAEPGFFFLTENCRKGVRKEHKGSILKAKIDPKGGTLCNPRLIRLFS